MTASIFATWLLALSAQNFDVRAVESDPIVGPANATLRRQAILPSTLPACTIDVLYKGKPCLLSKETKSQSSKDDDTDLDMRCDRLVHADVHDACVDALASVRTACPLRDFASDAPFTVEDRRCVAALKDALHEVLLAETRAQCDRCSAPASSKGDGPIPRSRARLCAEACAPNLLVGGAQ